MVRVFLLPFNERHEYIVQKEYEMTVFLFKEDVNMVNPAISGV